MCCTGADNYLHLFGMNLWVFFLPTWFGVVLHWQEWVAKGRDGNLASGFWEVPESCEVIPDLWHVSNILRINSRFLDDLIVKDEKEEVLSRKIKESCFSKSTLLRSVENLKYSVAHPLLISRDKAWYPVEMFGDLFQLSLNSLP